MGKKRIFELARELGYRNTRDLIEQLQKLGFEVKSHSSTVDEDAVRKALKKAEDEKRAGTDERRISRKVLRRRPKDEVAPAAPSSSRGSRSEPAEPRAERPEPRVAR